MSDLTGLTLAAARDGLAKKEFSATELTTAHLEAIEAGRALTHDGVELSEVLSPPTAPDRRERGREPPAGVGAGHAERALADVEREQAGAPGASLRQVRQQVLEVAQDRQGV